MIEIEKPDLIALTGDMVTGYEWDGSKEWYL